MSLCICRSFSSFSNWSGVEGVAVEPSLALVDTTIALKAFSARKNFFQTMPSKKHDKKKWCYPCSGDFPYVIVYVGKARVLSRAKISCWPICWLVLNVIPKVSLTSEGVKYNARIDLIWATRKWQFCMENDLKNECLCQLFPVKIVFTEYRWREI